MKTIDEDIKNKSFRQCYLLYGEEVYLKKQYRDKLVSAMTVKGDTMNFNSFEGKDVNPAMLIDLAETLPFLAERRVILVEDSGFFKNSCEALADYLPQMSELTCFLFVESEVDKRSKAYKAVKKSGAVVEFVPLNEAMLTKWILGRLKKEDKKITKDVLQMFLGRTGFSMSVIDRELEKLLCFTLKKEVIEASDVKDVVTERLEDKVFEMADAILGRNQAKAFDLYNDLLALKEAPMRILYLITRQLRVLAEVKELAGKGYGNSDIAQKVKVPSFAVRKYLSLAGNFTMAQLFMALEDAASLEEDVKVGRMAERIAVELFIAKYSGENQAAYK